MGVGPLGPLSIASIVMPPNRRRDTGSVRLRRIWLEQIADAPDGADVPRDCRIMFNQLAQPVNLDVEGTLIRFIDPTAGKPGEPVTRKHLPGVPRQRLQHRELAGSQRDALLSLPEGARCQIQREFPKTDRLLDDGRRTRNLSRSLSAQDRSDAGKKLLWVERFGDVVIRPYLQSNDSVNVLGFRTQHDDGHRAVRGPQPPTRGESILAGHHQVQDEQIDVISKQNSIHLLRGRCRLHLKSMLRKKSNQQMNNSRIVIYDKQFLWMGVKPVHAVRRFEVSLMVRNNKLGRVSERDDTNCFSSVSRCASIGRDTARYPRGRRVQYLLTDMQCPSSGEEKLGPSKHLEKKFLETFRLALYRWTVE